METIANSYWEVYKESCLYKIFWGDGWEVCIRREHRHWQWVYPVGTNNVDNVHHEKNRHTISRGKAEKTEKERAMTNKATIRLLHQQQGNKLLLSSNKPPLLDPMNFPELCLRNGI